MMEYHSEYLAQKAEMVRIHRRRARRIAAAYILASVVFIYFAALASRPIDGGKGDAKGYREAMNGAARYQARELLK